MQIIDKNGAVTVKLTQSEGRRLRDSSYILHRIAANLSDVKQVAEAHAAADLIKKMADEYCPNIETLDRQDAQQPGIPAK